MLDMDRHAYILKLDYRDAPLMILCPIILGIILTSRLSGNDYRVATLSKFYLNLSFLN